MDIWNGIILLSKLSGMLTKVQYCIRAFRTRPTSMISMALWNKRGLCYILVHFRDDFIAHYGDIKRNTFFSIGKYMTKRSSYRADSTIPKVWVSE